MRWIFLCLISFNLVYFAWMTFAVEGGRSAVDSAFLKKEQADGNGLILLKEMLPEAGSALPPPTINRSARFATPPVNVVQPKEVAPIVEEPAEGLGSEASAEVVADEAIEEVVDKVVEPPSELLAEEEAAPLEVEVPILERVCASLGPFKVKDEAGELANRVSGEGLSIKLREESVVAAIDNWVLLPAQGTRKDALRLLRELQGNKIDSYLVTEGEFRNAISLGLFKRSSSAQGVLEKMLSAGYPAEIHQIERTKMQYWVAVSGEYEAGKAEEMLTQLVDDSEKIKISESLCEMFASHP